jgi:hypothetical protein
MSELTWKGKSTETIIIKKKCQVLDGRKELKSLELTEIRKAMKEKFAKA